MRYAKAALLTGLLKLDASDRFGLVAFDHDQNWWTGAAGRRPPFQAPCIVQQQLQLPADAFLLLLLFIQQSLSQLCVTCVPALQIAWCMRRPKTSAHACCG